MNWLWPLLGMFLIRLGAPLMGLAAALENKRERERQARKIT